MPEEEQEPLLEEQEGKGYGADPGERKRALDEETAAPPSRSWPGCRGTILDLTDEITLSKTGGLGGRPS